MKSHLRFRRLIGPIVLLLLIGQFLVLRSLPLAPEQAKWAGISWPELMTWMVDHARRPA